MDNVVESIKISMQEYEGTIDYLQYLVYYANTCKDILKDILIDKTPGYSYSIDNYEHFMTSYRDTKIKYDYEYLEFLINHFPQYFGLDDYVFSFDFVNKIIEIYREAHPSLEGKTIVDVIDLEDYDELSDLRYIAIEVQSYEEVYKEVIKTKEPEYEFVKAHYNKFMEEFGEFKKQYNELFQGFLKKYAPDYQTRAYFGSININKGTLTIYINK